MRRKRGLRRAAPRSRAGKLALLAPCTAVMGFICARLIVLLADVRPYIGWYLLLAVAIGVAAAVAPPWAFAHGTRAPSHGTRGPSRWRGWLLIGYSGALVGGMRYYLSLRFNPPRSTPAAPPPPWFVAEVAGLSAVALTLVAITLLMLAVLAEVIAPGPVGRWLEARRARRASSPAKAAVGER